MNRVPPVYLALGRRLLENEAAPGETPSSPAVAERVCARLRLELGDLVGLVGFQALWQRALHLAEADFPLLQGVQTRDGACLGDIAEHVGGQDPDRVSAALVAVFGCLVWLLSDFIGEDLTLRQLRRIWPGVASGDVSAGTEEALQ